VTYLDHNASNPPDPRLLEVYARTQRDGWANPSSAHKPGRTARAFLETAREQVAALCGVAPARVTFGASGTELLNQALRTVAGPGAAIVASAVEHAAVLGPLEALQREGTTARPADVDAAGRVDVAGLVATLREVEAAGRPAALVAVLAAQNETGVLQPLDAIGAACAAAGVPLLVDACQAVGRVARDWARTPWDFLVVSGHKLRAPRGAAALVHRGRAPEPRRLLHGGAQELGRRAGTEDVSAIASLGEACALARAGALLDPAALLALRDAFEARLLEIPGLEVIARGVERLPQTTAVLVRGGDSEPLLAGLDLAGFAASAGSACSSGALEPSHVLRAMGVPDARARGRLRFSFGPETTRAELEAAAAALARLAPR